MNLFERIANRAKQALTGVSNTLDRDKSMPGFQAAQGGLTNRVSNFVGEARQNAIERNQQIGNDFSNDWQDFRARGRDYLLNTKVPQSTYDPFYSFGSGMISSQLGFTGAENLLPEGQ